MTQGRTACSPNGDGLDKPEAEQLPLVYLAHDLRAALAEMQAGIRLVQQLDLPDRAQQILKRCDATGVTMDRIIDQSVLVCLGKGQPGLTVPKTARTEDFLANLSDHWTGLCADSGHVFQLRPSPDLPRELYVDTTVLDRILSNLLTNTLTHTPPCQVTLSIDYDADGNSLILEIEDQGPGLPAPVLTMLRNRKPLPGGAHPIGNGFGFSSVRYLVSAMGGTCNFANAATGGAVAVLRLPLPTRPATAQVADAEAGGPLNLTGVSVLLGEDNPTCRILLETHFRKLGLSLTSLGDGMEIIDRLSQGLRPDLLVLDDQMPGLSGLGVLNWIRENLAAAERPAVLILTAQTTQDRALALRTAGAARVAPKQSLEAGRIGQLLRETLTTKANLPEPMTMDMSTLRRLTEIAGPLAAAELLARLDEDLEQTRRGLSQAAARIDMGGIRQHSHVLIALAGTAGAIALHDDAVRLNRFVHDAAPQDRILALAISLEQAIQDLQLAVQGMAATGQQEQPIR